MHISQLLLVLFSYSTSLRVEVTPRPEAILGENFKSDVTILPKIEYFTVNLATVPCSNM